MNEGSSLLECLSDDAVWRLEEVCCRFEQSWQAGQRPRLEEFLAGADGAERLALLRELLCLDVDYRQRAGEGPSREDYQTRFPEAAALLEEVFAPRAGPDGLRPMPETVDEPAGDGPGLLPPTTDDRPPGANGELPAGGPGGPASRYRVLRFHAAGALGEVFVAEDTELHREVALKEIKRQYADRDQSRGRFVLEGEITGRLEHPGVVPVYGLGTYPDGRPYYAMRFIRGENLAAAVQRFHAQAPVRFDALEFRQLLGRFVAVCQAVAYAHSRGVLHRDLKPGNIMLGKFGETLVVDWGLAKVLGRPGGAEAGPGEEGLLQPCAGDGVQTQGAVGTPAFMSPEQAAGKVAELAPATDVYSLGATLYAILTNRAPFQGPVGEVIQQVERGAWVPPRQVNGAVPAALDAVCRKAMALRPEERYGSAQALAEDVEHWLGDEPVAAYPEPRRERWRRWRRKHPKLVTAAVVSLVLAVFGLTLGTVLLEREKREAREAQAFAEEEVKYFLKEVDEDLLLNEPGMQPLRQLILQRVLEDYENFLAKRPGNPKARQQMAGTKRQLGELFGQVGQMERAWPLVEQAVELYEGLLRDNPADRELRLGLAHARYALADLRVQSGDPEGGKKEVSRAIELLKELWSDEPHNSGPLTLLARSYALRAMAEDEGGDPESGLDDLKKIPDVLEAPSHRVSTNGHLTGNVHGRITHYPGENGPGMFFMPWQDELMLARVYESEGGLLNALGRNAEGARVLQKAIVGYQLLLQRNSRPAQFRHGLALAQLHFGRVQAELGWPARAEPALREALGGVRQLVRDDPHSLGFKATHLLATTYLADDFFRRGRLANAAALLHEAEAKAEEVLGGPSRSRRQRALYARLLHSLGCLECESGGAAKALEYLQRAGEKLDQALKETPADRSLRSDWLENREVTARCRFMKGEGSLDGWVVEQEKVLAERTELAGRNPSSPRFQEEVAPSAVMLAGVMLEAGRPAEALACVDRVLPDHEQFVRAEQGRARAAAKEQAAADAPPSNIDSLGRGFLQMSQYLVQVKPVVPENSNLSRLSALLLARKAAALAKVGRAPEGVNAIRHAIDITDGLVHGGEQLRCPPTSAASAWSFLAEELYWHEPCYLYDLAGQLALASTLPGEAGLADPASRAVRALRVYAASGFDNAYKLRTDPDLEPLRQRDAFRKLLDDVENQTVGRKEAR